MIKEANRMSPALQTQPEIISLHQYEAFPEDKRVEVFDGIVYDMSSPSQIHQAILTELLVSLRNYIRGKGGSCSVFRSRLLRGEARSAFFKAQWRHIFKRPEYGCKHEHRLGS